MVDADLDLEGLIQAAGLVNAFSPAVLLRSSSKFANKKFAVDFTS